MSIRSQPTFAALVRVVALGAAQTHGSITITLYSLECYADGILINYGVEFDRTRQPEFDIAAADDCGTEYQGAGRGGGFGGSSRPNRERMFMRIQVGLAPASPIAARTLSLTFSLVQWFDHTHDLSPQHRVLPISDAHANDVLGPWQFIVSLPRSEEG